jgi:hypothetical protein
VLSDITSLRGRRHRARSGAAPSRHIEFVLLGDRGRFLCVLVTTEGLIENKLVPFDTELAPARSTDPQLPQRLPEAPPRARCATLREIGEEKNRYTRWRHRLALGKAAIDNPASDSIDRSSSRAANLFGQPVPATRQSWVGCKICRPHSRRRSWSRRCSIEP